MLPFVHAVLSRSGSPLASLAGEAVAQGWSTMYGSLWHAPIFPCCVIMVWESLSISGWGGNGPGLVHHVWKPVTCSHLSMLCYHSLGVPQHLWLGRQWPRAGPPCLGACDMLPFVHAVLSWSGSPLASLAGEAMAQGWSTMSGSLWHAPICPCCIIMVWESLSISGWGGSGPGLVHHVWEPVTCSHLSMLYYHGLGVP